MAASATAVRQRGPALAALSRNHVARYAAAAFGLVALVLFYVPWVSGTVPGVGNQVLTGLELARGDAAARADSALAGGISAGAAGAGSAAAGQAQSRSAGAGAAGASLGGLVLPTRIPTVTPPPSGQLSSGSARSATGATSGAAAAGASLGGLVLPTRIPTVTPPPSGQLSTSGTSGRLAGGGQANVVLEVGRQVERQKEPDRIPQFLLYLVPLAGLGLASFSIFWDRLYEARDRFFGKLWTLLLAYGGTLAVGNVLYMAITAPDGNDLLGPGEVHSVEWALWGVFLSFLLATVSITVAWLSPVPPPPDRYARLTA